MKKIKQNIVALISGLGIGYIFYTLYVKLTSKAKDTPNNEATTRATDFINYAEVLVPSQPATAKKPTVEAKTLMIRTGSSYISKAGYNLRKNTNPYLKVSITSEGENYKVYKMQKNMVIGGNHYTVAFVNRVRFSIINPFEVYMVIIEAFKAESK
jgi:hypothetical protein